MGCSMIIINIADQGIQLVAVGFTSLLSHAHTTVDDNASFQWFVSLQADNCFFKAVNVAWFMGSNCRNAVRIRVKNAVVGYFFSQKFCTFQPKAFCSVGWTCQKAIVPLVGQIILLYKIPYVNFLLPYTCVKIFPFLHC